MPDLDDLYDLDGSDFQYDQASAVSRLIEIERRRHKALSRVMADSRRGDLWNAPLRYAIGDYIDIREEMIDHGLTPDTDPQRL